MGVKKNRETQDFEHFQPWFLALSMNAEHITQLRTPLAFDILRRMK